MKRRRREVAVKPKDGVREARAVLAPGTTALALDDVIADLNVAERALFRVCADETRRHDANFSTGELDVIFAAHHAVKGVIGLLRQRDPWRAK